MVLNLAIPLRTFFSLENMITIKHLDRCAKLLQPHLGLDLREVLYPTDQDERRRTKDEE